MSDIYRVAEQGERRVRNAAVLSGRQEPSDRTVADALGSFGSGFAYENLPTQLLGVATEAISGYNMITGETRYDRQLHRMTVERMPAEEGYNPAYDSQMTGRYSDYAFVSHSRSQAETRERLDYLDRSRRIGGEAEHASFMLGRLLGAVADPSVIIPARAASSAVRGAAIMGSALMAEEAAKMALNPTSREPQNLAIAGVGGVAVGGIIGRLSSFRRARAPGSDPRDAEIVAGLQRRAEQEDYEYGVNFDDSVGAARSAQAFTEADADNIAQAFGFERWNDSILKGLMNSPSREVREFAQTLTQIPFFREANLRGSGSRAVNETRHVYQETQRIHAETSTPLRVEYIRGYGAYAEDMGVPTVDRGGAGSFFAGAGHMTGNGVFDAVSRAAHRLRGGSMPENFMTRQQFNEAVGRYTSMRRAGETIPEGLFHKRVIEVAENNSQFMERFAAALQQEGLHVASRQRSLRMLEERLAEASKRRWHAQRMTRGSARDEELNLWGGRVAGLEKRIARLRDEIGSIEANPPKGSWHMPQIPIKEAIRANPEQFVEDIMANAKVYDEADRMFKPPTRGQAEALREELLQRQLTDRLGTTGTTNPNFARQLQKRRWQIPTHKLEEYYLMDMEAMSQLYARNVAPDIALMRIRGRIDIDDVIDSAERAYARRMNKAKKNGDQKEIDRLERNWTSERKNIEALHGLIRGTYGLPDDPEATLSSVARIMKNLNSTMVLSGMTAQVPDIGNFVARHGFDNAFGAAAQAFRDGFEANTLAKMARDDARLMNEIFEVLLSSRAGTIADQGTFININMRAERIAQGLADFGFNVMHLMNIWNQQAKTIASMGIQTKLLNNMDELLRGGTLSEKDMGLMRVMGFDPEDLSDLQRIVELSRRYGGQGDQVRVANLNNWGADVATRLDENRSILEGYFGKLADEGEDLGDSIIGEFTRLMDELDAARKNFDEFNPDDHPGIQQDYARVVDEIDGIQREISELEELVELDNPTLFKRIIDEIEETTQGQYTAEDVFETVPLGNGSDLSLGNAIDELRNLREGRGAEFHADGFPEGLSQDVREGVANFIGGYRRARQAELDAARERLPRARAEQDELDEIIGELQGTSQDAMDTMRKRVEEFIRSQTRMEPGQADEVRALVNSYFDDVQELSQIRADRDRFSRGLADEIRNTIITPTPGDAHRVLSQEWGSFFLQFKRFGMSATQRILLSGMQLRDREHMAGLASMVLLGTGVEMLRHKMGPMPDQERDWRDVLIGGVERSGVAGYFMDVNMALEALTDNELGLRPLVGTDNQYRTSTRTKLGMIFGPSFSQGYRALELAGDISQGDTNQWSAYHARRLVPYNNITHWDFLFDQMEHGLRVAGLE